MNIKLPFLFLLCTISFSPVSAQYTEMINTNRPGGSQGAFSVGTNVLQVETGFSYGKEKHELLKTETNGFNIDYSVRYGFWKERLEFSLMGEFQSNSVTDNRSAVAREYSLSNFKSNTLGAKYLIYDPYRKRDLKGPNLYSWKANNKTQWADLIPAIAIYAGANFDFADNPFTPETEGKISPKFVLCQMETVQFDKLAINLRLKNCFFVGVSKWDRTTSVTVTKFQCACVPLGPTN